MTMITTKTDSEVLTLPVGLEDAIYNQALSMSDGGYQVLDGAIAPRLGDIVMHLGSLAIVSAILGQGVVQLYAKSVEPNCVTRCHFFAAAASIKHVLFASSAK